MSAEQPEEDEITWGSDELPIETMNSTSREGKTDFFQTLDLSFEIKMPCKTGF